MNNSAATRRISSIAIDYNGADGKKFGEAERAACNNLLSDKPEEIFREMKSVALRNPRVAKGKWALSGYISPPKEIAAKISNEELRDITLLALKRIGVTKNNQYILDIHNNSQIKHLHFIVNRIDTFGKCTIPSRNIGKRFGEEVRKICNERGLSTDIEVSKIKKDYMEKTLVDAMKVTRNFTDLEKYLNSKGFMLQLSSNEKVGISGLRITKFSDINTQTSRVYKSGFKLSEISKKLHIREIKQLFHLRELILNAGKIDSLIELRDFTQSNALQASVRFGSDNGLIQIFIKPKEFPMKNGYFFNKDVGFDLADISPHLNNHLISKLTKIPHHNSVSASNESIVLDTLLEILGPTFSGGSGQEDLHRKKRSIYDDPYLSY